MQILQVGEFGNFLENAILQVGIHLEDYENDWAGYLPVSVQWPSLHLSIPCSGFTLGSANEMH